MSVLAWLLALSSCVDEEASNSQLGVVVHFSDGRTLSLPVAQGIVPGCATLRIQAFGWDGETFVAALFGHSDGGLFCVEGQPPIYASGGRYGADEVFALVYFVSPDGSCRIAYAEGRRELLIGEIADGRYRGRLEVTESDSSEVSEVEFNVPMQEILNQGGCPQFDEVYPLLCCDSCLEDTFCSGQ